MAVAGNAFAQNPDTEPSAVIFLNRNGGTYTPGPDNSLTNRSEVLTSVAAIPAFSGTDDEWQTIVRHVAARFAPFSVSIVEVEPPPPVRYVEAVVGGHPSTIGQPPSVIGIAAIRCSPALRAVVFVLSDLVPAGSPLIWETVAHEAGHAFTLDHQYLCKDLMSYLHDCGQKIFMNRTTACGEFAERTCLCGEDAQNSFDKLMSVLGPRNGPPRPQTTQLQEQVAEGILGVCALAKPVLPIDPR